MAAQTCTYSTGTTCTEKDNTVVVPASIDPCDGATIIPVAEPETAIQLEENIAEETTTQTEFQLNVYPNPFKEKLNFKWIAPVDDVVKVEILDAFGNRLTVLYEGKVFAGKHYNFDWSSTGLQDHVYFYRYHLPDVVYGKLSGDNNKLKDLLDQGLTGLLLSHCQR
jgi:hypothetical protein